MNLRCSFAILVGILSLLLIAPFAHGQGRGMRGSSGGVRSGVSFRSNRGGELGRGGRRQFENGYGLPFGPAFYPDYSYSDSDLDYTAPAPFAPPYQYQSPAPQAYQPPAPPPAPGNPLILENHDGQWVRIPTGGEMVNGAKLAKVDSDPSTAAIENSTVATEAEPPRPALPPAVLVFRDGHTEQVQKYVIQGSNLYATSAYSTTGSWTKKIPLADLDIPASLQVNKDRGTKFNLPSGPNEVVVRF